MLDKISAICSISGFIVSLATFGYAFFIEKRVREFEKNVLFNTRISVLINNLKQHNSQLFKDLDVKDARRIRETINLCITIIEDINSKLSGELRKRGIKIKRVLKRQYNADFLLEKEKTINWRFWIHVTTLDNLWKSYDDLNSLITRIENLKKDKRIIQ